MEPTIIEPLKEAFSETIINKIEKKYGDWYEKVNNSTIFQKLLKEEVIFFKRNAEYLDRTIERIYKAKPISTKMTV